MFCFVCFFPPVYFLLWFSIHKMLAVKSGKSHVQGHDHQKACHGFREVCDSGWAPVPWGTQVMEGRQASSSSLSSPHLLWI